MSNLNHKPRRSRTFRLELLESRELLSAVGLPGHHAAEVSLLARAKREIIKGSLSGQGTVNPITSSQGTTTGDGSGTTTVLGPATFQSSVSYSANKRHVLKYTNGTGTLAGLSGTINASFSGSGRVVGVEDFTFSVKGLVTGGTGTLTGAAGSFTAKGTLNGGVFSINLTVTLKRI
ncbi:MAG: hypothetical protein ACHRXM_12340 [Isosphaerales bacterium]